MNERSNSVITIVALGLFCAIGVVMPWGTAADFELARWGFSREIVTPPEAQNAEFALIELDGAVYQNAQESLHDLRVVDDQNREVAAMVLAPTVENETTIPAQIVNRQAANGASVYTIDCGTEQHYNGIDIATSSQNFSRRVQIEGTTDGVWRLLRNDGYVMDFSRDEQKSVSQIRFTTSSYRYLRVTIFEAKETGLAITNIALLPAQKNATPFVEVPIEVLSQTDDKKLRASVLTLKLPTLKLPNSRLELLIDGTNFHRQVEIESTNDAPDKSETRWFRAGSGEVHDLTLDKMKLHNVTIEYRDTRAGFLRVKVFNRDDQPLKIRGAKVFLQPWQLLFKRTAGRSYRLFYGNEKAIAPQYDLTQLAAYLKPANLPKFTLGQETPLRVTPTPEPTNSTRNSVLVSVAILITVVVLGGLIYRLARASTS